jgi:hypothetical protein
MCRISGNGIEGGTSEYFLRRKRWRFVRLRNPRRASPAAFRRGIDRRDFWSERVDPCRQPRQLARDRVFVEHAFGYRPMQLGLRLPESRLCRRLVPGCDRRLDLFHKGAHAANSGAIDGRTLGRLPDALFRGFVISHAIRRDRRRGLYRGLVRDVNFARRVP